MASYSGRLVCNSCRENIIGFRYYSLHCVNYNMCSSCERKSVKCELFIRLFEPIGDYSMEQHWDEEFLREMIKLKLETPINARISGISHYVTCSGCRAEIRNIRYKCIDCPSIEYCGYCKDICREHRRHLLIRIVHPLHLHVATGTFVTQIIECRKYFRERQRNRVFPLEVTHVSEQDEYKYTVCDSCGELIQGFIFKCLDCPDFHLCSDCEHSDWHSGHLFIRFEESLNEETGSILQQIICMRLSPNFEELNDVDWEEDHVCPENSDPDLHEGIGCDKCNGSCYGFRYKCVQCPDYDLCADCQNAEHHNKHLLIRIAEPISTNVVNRKFIENVMAIGSSSNSQQSGDEEENERHGEDAASDDSWATIDDEDDPGVDVDTGKTIIPKADLKHNQSSDKDSRKPYRTDENPSRYVRIESKNQTKASSPTILEKIDLPKPSTSGASQQNNGGEKAIIQNCTICYDLPSNVIFLDCGHLCICVSCLPTYVDHFTQCPICKTEITKPPCRVYY